MIPPDVSPCEMLGGHGLFSGIGASLPLMPLAARLFRCLGFDVWEGFGKCLNPPKPLPLGLPGRDGMD